MPNKLQELTDKLCLEGLTKGRKAGEEILAKSKQQAQTMLEEAEKKAERIKARAIEEAENIRVGTKKDIRTASEQALQATKKRIENLIVSKITDLEVDKALSTPDFVKGIIREVAGKFNAEEPVALNLVIPESMQKELEPFVKNELGKLLKNNISAEFSKKIKGGFTIGPKDGNYYISMSDETFRSLISEYMRPAARKLLYGEE